MHLFRKSGFGLFLIAFVFFSCGVWSTSVTSRESLLDAAAAVGQSHEKIVAEAQILVDESVALLPGPLAPEQSRFDQSVHNFSRDTAALGYQMDEFQSQINRIKDWPVFRGRMRLWRDSYKKLSQQLDALKSDKTRESTSGDAREILKTSKMLDSHFQVMNNVIDIFRLSPQYLRNLSLPEGPPRTFYAVRDKKRGHVVWPERARLADLLLGKVKGQDYAYRNSGSVPYCQRCHAARSGSAAFWFDRALPAKPAAVKPAAVKRVAAKPRKVALLPPPSKVSVQRLTNMFDAASQAAKLHSALLETSEKFAVKSSVVSKKVDLFGPADLSALTSQIAGGAEQVSDSVDSLDSAMKDLREDMGSIGVADLFRSKLDLWEKSFARIVSLNGQLRQSTQELKSPPSDKGALSDLLTKTSDRLNSIHRDSKALSADFQSMGNILVILRAVPSSVLSPPAGRVRGEGWEAHRERTDHVLIQDVFNPPALCDHVPSPCHSVYAVEDNNPNHTVWACEATLSDFLSGHVKGQEHAYANDVNIPYCQRCHVQRKGKAIMWFNKLQTSKAMGEALSTLQKAIK